MTVEAPAPPARAGDPPPPRRGPAAAPPRNAALPAHALLAAVAYVPLLLTLRGRVVADTKTALTVDPGALLARVVHMWDATVAMGTVSHQAVGYLFPMGPWFWVFDRLGAPDWVAQRLWLGTVVFAAGAGVLHLARALRWRGAGPVAAAVVYLLSPYALSYATRMSALLLPWAALPWLVGLTVTALRRGGWRHPALIALVAATTGSINASSLIYAALAPAVWLPFAVWAHREATARQAAALVGKVAVLTAAASLWWAVPLVVQAGYGPPVLQFSETLDTVASSALSSEALRGLGYWVFYGGDRVGPWVTAAVPYTQDVALVVVGFALSGLALLAGAALRWRYRAYFAALVVVGAVVVVGLHPYEQPSPAAAVVKAVGDGSGAALALRSSPRAAPVVVLGLAVLLGAAVTAVGRRARWAGVAAGATVAVLAAANLPVLWTGDYLGEELARPEELPAYWEEAATWLDARRPDHRVLAVPGADFAAHRWGNTLDPVLPDLLDRPYAARELIGYGGAAAADLLAALDRRVQEGLLEPEALAPVARLMSVGDVVVQSDLEFERYRLPRPRLLWDALTPAPPGLHPPVGFGETVENRAAPDLPLVDEVALGAPLGLPDPPPVAAFPVDDARPVLRASPAGGAVVLAGDGEGVLDAAAAGLLDGRGTIVYSAALDDAGWDHALDGEAHLVLTDTNRRRARRWRTVRENVGYTERAGEQPLRFDPADARLAVFPDAGDEARTVAEHRGGVTVSATAYGNPVTYTPEDRPAMALDGDVRTAWRVGAFSDVVGERLVLDFDERVTADAVTLLQPVTGVRNRWITRARLTFDDGPAVEVDLGEASRQAPGQVVDVAPRTFTHLEIEVLDTDLGRRPTYDGASPVGFAEVGVAGARVEEVLRLPTDLLDEAGDAAADERLTVVVTRQRTDPTIAVRDDEEPALARTFRLPVGRAFTLAGTARVSARAPEADVDAVLGVPAGVTAASSGSLPGAVHRRAAAAADGDPTTWWSPPFLQDDPWVELVAPTSVTVDRLDLRLVADGRHSVPTRLRVEAEGREPVVVEVPPVADGAEPGTVVAAPVTLPPLRTDRLRVVVEEVREVRTVDWFSDAPITLPVGVAEIGAGLTVPALPLRLPEGCRADLLTVDDRPVPVRVSGTTADAVARAPLAVQACEGPLELGAGDHEVRTAAGRDTGVDLDRLVLDSAAGGAPAPSGLGPAAAPPAPEVTGATGSSTAREAAVTGVDGPFWLVLAESHSEGWRATAEGLGDLGPPALVGPWGNGWWVDPGDAAVDGRLAVSLRWEPQRWVWAGYAAGALAVLACLVLAARPSRRRGDDAPGAAPALAWPSTAAGRALRPIPALAAGVLTGAGVGLATRPVIGLAVGAATAVALVTRRGRTLLVAGTLGGLGVAGADVAVEQLGGGIAHGFDWPRSFPTAHVAGWVAVGALAGDVVVEVLRRRRARGPDGPVDDGGVVHP